MYYFKDSNIDSLFYYSDKLKESNDVCKQIQVYNCKAYGFYKLKNYAEAEKITLESIEKINLLLKNKKATCYIDGKMAALNRLFWIKKNQEDYNEAYGYILLMQEVNKLKDKNSTKYLRNKIMIKIARATVKRALKMESIAKNILLSAYNDLKQNTFLELKNDDAFLEIKANLINSLGDLYMDLSARDNSSIFIDSAAYYYDKAYKITKLFNPLHKSSKIIYNFRKTEVLMARKEFAKAINLTNNYKNIHNGYNYSHREHFEKAICFYNLKNTDSTIYYSNNFLKDPLKCKPSKLITIYDILSNQYNQLNQLDSAYKYSKLTIHQFNLAKANKEKTFNLFYNNNFNKAQELYNSIQEKEEKKRQKLIISFTVLLLAFIILISYLLMKEKKRKKKLMLIMNNNKPIEAEKKEYNIDTVLENKILDEFKITPQNLDFLKSDFSINHIAEKLNTNTTYVSFVFNKHHDESFKQYCTKLKINYVVEKLKTDKNFKKYSIQAIAEEIGYTNASALTRAFKKHIGVTPSTFLKNLES
ncbi:helix-turn-helix domain-containing protein [Tenacibaculum sediminilitoris]|uniref:helix-turn-helix domain-containing protein n=1 Tax=Tenacibaculum sediminilitoris TaxID=1820334 RepID=UPI0038B51877